jgi:hypothetical protein
LIIVPASELIAISPIASHADHRHLEDEPLADELAQLGAQHDKAATNSE